MVEKIDKPWGYEEILVRTDEFVVKKIFIEADQCLSLQFHKKKKEMIYVLDGACAVFHGGQWITIVKDGFVYIPNYGIHRFEAAGAKSTLLIEISTPELGDVERIEDKYGRV